MIISGCERSADPFENAGRALAAYIDREFLLETLMSESGIKDQPWLLPPPPVTLRVELLSTGNRVLGSLDVEFIVKQNFMSIEAKGPSHIHIDGTGLIKRVRFCPVSHSGRPVSCPAKLFGTPKSVGDGDTITLVNLNLAGFYGTKWCGRRKPCDGR